MIKLTFVCWLCKTEEVVESQVKFDAFRLERYTVDQQGERTRRDHDESAELCIRCSEETWKYLLSRRCHT